MRNNQENIIELSHCYVEGVDPIKRLSSLRAAFLFSGKIRGLSIPILQDINLSCKPGDRIGLIGKNGSGKSSLLKTIAGIYPITKGKCKIQGKVGSIIEMGLGMEYDLTGRENIKILMLYNNMLHMYNPLIEQEIIDFSEIGKNIDQPVKNYSSGMISRLAFSVLIFQNPEIFLLDEVFATGDRSFVDKSVAKLEEKIKTVAVTILVSHQEDILRKYCNKAILMENSMIKQQGDVEFILNEYHSR